jgi:hypothetical protein
MIHHIVSAEYQDGYKIKITFDDGKTGVVDFSQYAQRGGVFAPFRDLAFFRSFEINREWGVLTWPGEIDIAPETLYAEATGTPLPDWMEQGEPSGNQSPQPMSALSQD